MATKKAKKPSKKSSKSTKASSKKPAMLNLAALRRRQSELQELAERGDGPPGPAPAGCVWIPEDEVLIRPDEVTATTKWRLVCFGDQ